LEDYRIENIENKIKEIIQIPSNYLNEMATRTVEYTHENHNAESYKEDILNALNSFGV